MVKVMVSTPNFATLLRDWRRSHKYTQEDASKLFGVSHSMYGFWETSRYLPSASRINEIAKIMMLSPAEITSSILASNQKKKQVKEVKKYNVKANPQIALAKPDIVPAKPIVKEEPKEPSPDFDNLLMEYADKLNEKKKLMTEWLALKDKLDGIKTELLKLRDKIRSAA